jgi:hypothetical protein
MAVGHSFRDGRNSICRMTKLGFERKAELLACEGSWVMGCVLAPAK